jgi:hypothetical protein
VKHSQVSVQRSPMRNPGTSNGGRSAYSSLASTSGSVFGWSSTLNIGLIKTFGNALKRPNNGDTVIR